MQLTIKKKSNRLLTKILEYHRNRYTSAGGKNNLDMVISKLAKHIYSPLSLKSHLVNLDCFTNDDMYELFCQSLQYLIVFKHW